MKDSSQDAQQLPPQQAPSAVSVAWPVIAIGLSALVVIVAAFLPWATLGPFTKNGTEGDGVLTLVLGLIAGALCLWAVRSGSARAHRAAGLGAVIAGGFCSLIAVVDLNNFDGVVSRGIGLPLTLVAGIAVAVFGLVHLLTTPRS